MTDRSLAPEGPNLWPDPKGTPRHSDLAARAPSNPDAFLRHAVVAAVRQLRLWVPLSLPASPEGTAHFVRDLTDSLADRLEAALDGREPDPEAPFPNSPDPAVPADRMLACARRELALRKAVYPGMVARKSLGAREAGEGLAAMEAIVALLEAVAAPPPPPAEG